MTVTTSYHNSDNKHLHISLPVQGRITCDFTVLRVTEQFVVLRDDCNEIGGRSVTNAAEQVVAWCLSNYPGRRIVCKDTDGVWDEIAHDGKAFVRFKPMPACFALKEE